MKNKRIIICLIIALVLIIINLFSSLDAWWEVQKRKDDGNQRWNQVENRIVKIEADLNDLKKEVDNARTDRNAN